MSLAVKTETQQTAAPMQSVMGYDVMLPAHELLRGQNSSITDG